MPLDVVDRVRLMCWSFARISQEVSKPCQRRECSRQSDNLDWAHRLSESPFTDATRRRFVICLSVDHSASTTSRLPRVQACSRSLTGICIKSLTQDEMTHRTLSSVARCIHNHEDELSNKQHRPGDTSPGLPLDRGFLSGTAISRGGPSHFLVSLNTQAA